MVVDDPYDEERDTPERVSVWPTALVCRPCDVPLAREIVAAKRREAEQSMRDRLAMDKGKK